MPLMRKKVTVEALEDGQWSQGFWSPKLKVVKGQRVSISRSIAGNLQYEGKCMVLNDYAIIGNRLDNAKFKHPPTEE